MAAPQGGGGGQSDNSMGMIWGIAAIFAVLGVIWYIFKKQLVAFYLHIKLYEADFLSLFFPEKYNQIKASISSALLDPAKVSFTDIMSLGSQVGDYLRYPFILILLVLAVLIYFGNTTRSFKRAYQMRELAELEKDNWPQIAAVLHQDLLQQDIDKGPWAMALTPMQFCKRFRLLDEVRPQRREGMSRKDWDRIDVVLRRGDANKVFALQLGPLWKNVESLPPHTKALFAVFAARLNADTQPAMNLLLQLNRSPANKLNMAGVDELLKKHINSKGVQEIVQTHAYVYTVMASMLEGAREDGVQASADFLWLKPIDRKLWYTLNTVGRQTPFVEVAGIFAHWVAELEAGKKLLVPMVEEATKAIEIALTEVVYKPDEEATTQ